MPLAVVDEVAAVEKRTRHQWDPAVIKAITDSARHVGITAAPLHDHVWCLVKLRRTKQLKTGLIFGARITLIFNPASVVGIRFLRTQSVTM